MAMQMIVRHISVNILYDEDNINSNSSSIVIREILYKHQGHWKMRKVLYSYHHPSEFAPLSELATNLTSRNNPIRPIFKLPKGGRNLVECLPIIFKKIGKFGIAELVQLGCHLPKIQPITFGKKN